MSIALIHMCDDGYVISFHEFIGAPAYAKELYPSLEMILIKYADYCWRKPEVSEAMGKPMFIGS